MINIKEFIFERLNKSCILDVKDNHFIIIYNSNTTSYDPKFKYALILANFYTNTMKSFGWEREYKDNIKEVYLHDEKNWDLPEVIFSTDDKLLKNIIKDINNDRYFVDRSSENFTAEDIVNINNWKSQIDLYNKKSLGKKTHRNFKPYVKEINYDDVVDKLYNQIYYRDNKADLLKQLKQNKSIYNLMNSMNWWDKLIYFDKNEKEELIDYVETNDKKLTKDVIKLLS